MMVEEFAARCGISNGLLWMLKRFGHAFRTTKPGNTFRGTDSGGGTGGTLSSGDYHGELCKSCRGRIMDDDDMHEEGARTCDFCGTAWRWCMAGEAASEPDHARPSPSPEDPLWRESSGSQKTGTTSRRSNWICRRTRWRLAMQQRSGLGRGRPAILAQRVTAKDRTRQALSSEFGRRSMQQCPRRVMTKKYQKRCHSRVAAGTCTSAKGGA
mmetsp:Transcript_57209/g.135147  ORF Transcript_57209/g.135147 Transcript_57209/m.135147 type:complete len:212 (-) Transcript_57209:471-1106(-)